MRSRPVPDQAAGDDPVVCAVHFTGDGEAGRVCQSPARATASLFSLTLKITGLVTLLRVKSPATSAVSLPVGDLVDLKVTSGRRRSASARPQVILLAGRVAGHQAGGIFTDASTRDLEGSACRSRSCPEAVKAPKMVVKRSGPPEGGLGVSRVTA